MREVLVLLNDVAVGIFGMVLSAAFCDMVWTKQRKQLFALCITVILLVQGCIYFFIDPTATRYLYPVITHLPLAAVLCIMSRRVLWPTVSVLAAYLCCQLRRWLALLVTALSGGGELIQTAAELIITVPLLLALLHFVAPSIRAIARFKTSLQWQFGLIPALGYAFDYLTRVYTDLLAQGVPAAVEFMPFVCCVAYLVFAQRSSAENEARSRLERTQDSLNLQVAQAMREISSLRESERQARTYRHDLRHHMQFLSSCIESGRTEQAQAYIHQVCSEIEAWRVTAFCENEAANLIFSSFAGRAGEQRVALQIHAEIPQTLPVTDTDLCVLLSNALENALHACRRVQAQGREADIDVLAYEKNGRLFLQITNPCTDDVVFERDIPVSTAAGHGIGVQSICAITERYDGICSFSVKDGRFILRVSL